MGIASTDVAQDGAGTGGGAPPDDKGNAPAKAAAAVPTYLSGESLTFPLITSVGAAALTMYAAATGSQPTAGTVIVVAIICGFVVVLWGVSDARAQGKAGPKLDKWELFRRVVIGLANTILLSVALWGGVKVAQTAIG